MTNVEGRARGRTGAKAPRKLRAGVDLGGTKIESIVVDRANNVLGSSRHPTPLSGGPPAVAEAIITSIRQACEEAKSDPMALGGIGVGSPGLIDAETGTVTGARNLSEWDGQFALGPALSKALSAPVRLGNDVQVATDAEYELGAGRGFSSVLGVFWGTGVGGGIILGGEPWLGRGGAGEIGHTVVKVGGARCPCGRRGCLEAYAGRAAMEGRARRLLHKGARTDLFKLMERHGRDRLTSGIWARALEHGDGLAHEIIERAIMALGAGVASAVNLLDVEAVIIGGGLGVRFGDPYTRRIESAMAPHLFNDTHPPKVLTAALGDLGGAIGASLLVR